MLAEADAVEFAESVRGVDAQRPQCAVDRHVRPVGSPVVRFGVPGGRPREARPEDDAVLVPGDSRVGTLPAEELAVRVENDPLVELRNCTTKV